jgi:RNA polymerase sigma factor (sigma-70 family)
MKARPRLARRPDCKVAWSDERLVRHCLRGDEEAWVALIDRYKRLIYSIPFRYRIGPDDAADVFQAVCLDLFEELPRLRKVESLRSWLITVAVRKCLRRKERQTRRGEADLEPFDEEQMTPGPGSVPDFVGKLEREQMLREATARLAPRCRELIDLLFYREPALPYEEVARRLGLATGSIGFIRGRCLKRLQRILTDMGF